ncbi:MAG: hypothetical protein HZB26_17290 [Candidatus Hydrogenedentes bacterium]|nr:hypothetical protein [Candidatus Hydrogenedentota bacterium]
MKTYTLEEARSAKARVATLLQNHRDLTGVGITRVGKGYAVKVNMATAPGADLVIPPEMDGVPVRVEVTGRIKARTR